jgi:hypothetical protein
MSMLGIKMNFLKFKNAAVIPLKGNSGVSKRCLVIPIEDNDFFETEKGVFSNLVAFEASLSDGKTHLVKPSIKKEVLAAMTDEQRSAIPIIGDIKPFGVVDASISNPDGLGVEETGGTDDLPF